MPVTQVPTLRWLSGLLQSAAAGPPLHWDMSTSPLAWNVRLCLIDSFRILNMQPYQWAGEIYINLFPPPPGKWPWEGDRLPSGRKWDSSKIR